MRGWQVPENENPDDKGYLIEKISYQDSNHPDYKGYISWIPDWAFEVEYESVDSMGFGEALFYLKKRLWSHCS